MRDLVSTPKFERSYRKLVRRNRTLQEKIDAALRQMALDVFHPSLQTHKLGGKLTGLWASSCGYDCRHRFSDRERYSYGQGSYLAG
jgi:mRNA interferase YafQ